MITPNTAWVIASVLLCGCLSCNNGKSPGAAATTADTLLPDSSTISTEMASPQPPMADTLKHILINTLVKNDLDVLTENDRRFRYAETDLNGDGKNEIFVGMQGNYFCGNAGCTVYLLTNAGKRINTFTIVDGPIAVSADKTHGWNDLIVSSRGINYVVKHNGKAYPSNPSVQPEFKGAVGNDVQKVLTANSPVYTF